MYGKKMFHVQKFVPTECPKCRFKLDKNPGDWSFLFGDVVAGEKVIRQTSGYDIIRCEHCKNLTARVMLEEQTFFDRSAAEKMCEELGFVNFREVYAFGSHAKEHRKVFNTLAETLYL